MNRYANSASTELPEFDEPSQAHYDQAIDELDDDATQDEIDVRAMKIMLRERDASLADEAERMADSRDEICHSLFDGG